jgi:ribosomal-protein-alanine N-acetyltransferase
MKEIAEDLFDKFPEMETERCRLRQIKDEDANTLYEILSDYDTMQYFGIELAKDPQEIANSIELRKKGFKTKRGIGWIIADKSTDKMLGLVNFPFWMRQFFISRLSYILHKDNWENGYMTEVLPVCLKFGFEKMALHRIEAVINPLNKPSLKLVEKLGFKREGMMEEHTYNFIHDRFDDTYLYCLLKRYWKEEN